VLKHLKTGENEKETVFLGLHKVVKKSAKMGILPMPEEKMTSYKGHTQHFTTVPILLHLPFWGEIKIPDT